MHQCLTCFSVFISGYIFLIFNMLNILSYTFLLHASSCWGFYLKFAPRYFMHSALLMMFPFMFISVVSNFNSSVWIHIEWILFFHHSSSVSLCPSSAWFLSHHLLDHVLFYSLGFCFSCQSRSSFSLSGHLQSHWDHILKTTDIG